MSELSFFGSVTLVAGSSPKEGERGRPPRADSGLIVELYRQGVPPSVIAKTTGIRIEHIPRALRRAGIEPDRVLKTSTKPLGITSNGRAVMEAVAKAMLSGSSRQQAAQEIGISYAMVRYYWNYYKRLSGK